MSTTTSSTDLRSSLRSFALVYIRFLKHPVQEIRSLPDWSWKNQILNQVLVTATTGGIAGFLKSSILGVAQGIVLVPLITAFTILVATLFFYFFFQVFAGTTLHFRRLMELIFFANIPFFIFQTVAHWFPPISLFGLSMAALLMIVGLCDNFQLERRLVIRTVAAVYILFLAIWAWTRIEALRFESHLEKGMDTSAPEIELGK